MLDIPFLNKNLYRRYPLRSNSTMVSEQGIDIPLTLIASMGISTKYGFHNLYVSKIVVNGDYINITISHTSPDTTIGYFSATITEDFQIIQMTATQSYSGGYMVFGLKEALGSIQGSNNFTFTTAALEDSIVTCIKAPVIKGIEVNDELISGAVTLKYDNIKQTLAPYSHVTLDVIDVTSIASRIDKSTERMNCGINMIGSINGVKPTTAGNIDIYGILPVVIEVTSTGIQVTTPGIGFNELCTNVKNNIPPTPAVPDEAKSQYQEDFLTASQEEWKTWPQYSE